MNNELIFIGEIETPYKQLSGCPKNVGIEGAICKVKIYDEYKEGLYGLQKGNKIVILYWLDKSSRTVSIAEGFSGKGELGTFARRTPNRPNPIGLATLEIIGISENEISVTGLDCLDGTKLIDIKPAI